MDDNDLRNQIQKAGELAKIQHNTNGSNGLDRNPGNDVGQTTEVVFREPKSLNEGVDLAHLFNVAEEDD